MYKRKQLCIDLFRFSSQNPTDVNLELSCNKIKKKKMMKNETVRGRE